MIKKIFILSAMVVFVAVFTSCEKEEFQPNSLQTSEKTETSTLKATTAGWVMQPAWNYSGQSSKTFNIGNLGLVVTGTNSGTAETIVLVQERDYYNNPLIEHSFRMASRSNGSLSVIPQSSTKKIVITTLRAGSSGTVSGSIIVNSKY